MFFDNSFFEDLSKKAKESPRLRVNFDLRNSPEDGSQRMLNALEPGTVLPIHRHRKTSEIMVVIKGSVKETFYNESGEMTSTRILKSAENSIIEIPVGQWHSLECLESGTIIYESKDGKYEPTSSEDILK